MTEDDFCYVVSSLLNLILKTIENCLHPTGLFLEVVTSFLENIDVIHQYDTKLFKLEGNIYLSLIKGISPLTENNTPRHLISQLWEVISQ